MLIATSALTAIGNRLLLWRCRILDAGRNCQPWWRILRCLPCQVLDRRIDTDQLNLGFMYLMFGLGVFAGRSKSRISSLAWCVAAGLTANLFMWWYGKPELIFVAAIALFWLLACLQRNLVTAVCGHNSVFIVFRA